MSQSDAGGEGGLVLTLNGGSSSLKFGLFAPGPERRLAGSVERVGLSGATLTLRRGQGEPEREPVEAKDLERAFEIALARLGVGPVALAAVGHRVVHGGPRYAGPIALDDEALEELRRLSPLDPAHLPAEIALIEEARRWAPGLAQVACFDTAFHHAMPRVAQLLPLPRRLLDAGLRRYGFHGLSYAFLMEELGRIGGARGGVVLAHLGSGSSLVAVRDGRPVDTTMGFTPAGGVPMATRSGDLDPGLLVHLMRAEGLDVDRLDELVNRRSGLVGVSGRSPDMRDLLAAEATDRAAADAVELYAYQVKKAVGALAAALGGLDALVFSGGVGERAPSVRARICEGLGHLGVKLDGARNEASAPVISEQGARCTVRVVPTDEETMIARLTYRTLQGETTP